MPLNLSFTHIVVVGIVALVVLGPERLPGVARSAGRLYREWKRISSGLEAEVREVFADFTEPFADTFIFDEAVPHGEPQPDEPEPSTPSIAVPPLSAAMPTLGPSTGLVSPGPTMALQLPELAPPPEPRTFVPFEPFGSPAS